MLQISIYRIAWIFFEMGEQTANLFVIRINFIFGVSLHPNSESALDFYFQNQQVTKSIIGKLPAIIYSFRNIETWSRDSIPGSFHTTRKQYWKKSRFNPNLHILHEEAKSHTCTSRIPKEISRGRVQNRT